MRTDFIFIILGRKKAVGRGGQDRGRQRRGEGRGEELPASQVTLLQRVLLEPDPLSMKDVPDTSQSCVSRPGPPSEI